jgi:adenylate cyclase
VSGSVREQVHGNADVCFDDIGEQQVKNIARPIRVFRVALGNEASQVGSRRRWQRLARAPRLRWLAAGVLALGVAGIVVWAGPHFWQTAPAPTAPPFSIALLPLSAPSGAPADQQLADRLTQDLTTALGRWRIAHVASRGLVAAYHGKAVDARTAGRDLTVRHVVEGEVGRTGDKTVVTVRVVDTATGAQEWSDRMEFESTLLEGEPMALLAHAYTHLRIGIQGVEMRRAVKKPTPASALNLKLRGDAAWHVGSEDLTGVLEARRLYDEALRLDPSFVPALLGRFNTLHWELYENLDADRARFVAEMDVLSRRMVALDDQDPAAWRSRVAALGWLGRWDEAFEAYANSETLDPAALVYNLEWNAWLEYATGRPAEAIALTHRAVAIDPPGKLEEAMNLCRGNLMLGRYRQAESACEKAATLDDATWHNQVLLLAASAQNGDMQKAAVAKTELLKRQPGFSIAKDKAARLSDHPDYLKMLEAHYFPGLRKAGIPEN